jgi:DNA-binding transcriptional MerR regulator
MGPRDVARATGVSTDTLRHYERKGLLPKVARTTAGYRRYTTATVDRVLLIQRALVVGFSLDELKQVLTMRDQGGAPCRSVRTLVGRRLDGLERRIQELLALRDELRVLLAQWDGKLANTVSGQRVSARFAWQHGYDRARPVYARASSARGRRSSHPWTCR